MQGKDTVGHTFLVAFILCMVCSLLVSVSVVFLKENQDINKEIDKKKNILNAAGLLKSKDKLSKDEIFERFKPIKSRVIEFNTGLESTHHVAEDYNQRKASRDPASSVPLTRSEDIAHIKRVPKFGTVYEVFENGELSAIILPISGFGLWSTLYGFLALEADTVTVKGIAFYEHGETPGLGGEVDNLEWKGRWPGKKVFDENGKIKFTVFKAGTYKEGNVHGVDGLSGATITTRGVNQLIRFWLGDLGYGKYLKRIRNDINNEVRN